MLGPGGHEAESDGKDTVFPVLKISCPQDTASVWIMDFCTIPGAILHIIVRSTSLPSYFLPFQAVSQITLLPSKFLINLDFTNYPTATWTGLKGCMVFCCKFQISFRKSVALLPCKWVFFLGRTTRNWIWILPHLIFLSGKHFPSRESELC